MITKLIHADVQRNECALYLGLTTDRGQTTIELTATEAEAIGVPLCAQAAELRGLHGPVKNHLTAAAAREPLLKPSRKALL